MAVIEESGLTARNRSKAKHGPTEIRPRALPSSVHPNRMFNRRVRHQSFAVTVLAV